MNKKTKSRKNIVSFMNNLKGLSVPFKVTLIPKDEEYKRKHEPYTYTDTHNVPMGMVDSDENCGIYIFSDNREYDFNIPVIDNNRPYHNRKSVLDKIEKEITDKVPEYVINDKRWTVLDDILNDPNPQPLV
jgi:hypothetical protein